MIRATPIFTLTDTLFPNPTLFRSDDNEQNLIRVGELGARQLRVLARYSPSFPCLLEGIVKAGDRQAEAFRGYMLHINLEILPNSPREYDENDRPKFGAEDRKSTRLNSSH